MASLTNTASKIKSTAKNMAGNYLSNDSRNTPYFDDNQFFKDLDDRNKWVINDRNNEYEKVRADTGRQFDKAQAINDRRNNEATARETVREQNNSLNNMWARSNMPGNAGSFSQSTGSAFGNWSGSSINRGGNLNTSYGFDDIVGNTNRARDYDFQRSQSALTASMMTRAEAAGDIARLEAQTEQQNTLAMHNQNRNIDYMNRQSSLDAQRTANDRVYQSGQADKDRSNQRYIAQLDANTRMYQSMFNGNGNGFQYWGGSI